MTTIDTLVVTLRRSAEQADFYLARLMRDAADALEAADQRADLADADLEVEQQKNAGYRSRNDALAAVVEKVRSVIESESGWFRYRAERASNILATAPADALREVKADVWDEGAKAQADTYGMDVDTGPNPYRKEQS